MKALDYNGLDHVVDKIYDLVNSGGSADYIVAQGIDGVWYWRKWASGIAECWYNNYDAGSCAFTNGPYGTSGHGAYYMTKTGYTYPTGLFIEPPNISVTTFCSAGLLAASVYNNTASEYSLYIWDTKSETLNVKLNGRAIGLWKTFTPSVSAKSQVGYEDFASSVVVNSKLTTNANYLFVARRVGNIAFLRYCGTTNAQITSATTEPLLTLPHTCAYQLGGYLYNGAAGNSRPLIRVDGNKVYEQWASTLASGTVLEFWCAYVVQS